MLASSISAKNVWLFYCVEKLRDIGSKIAVIMVIFYTQLSDTTVGGLVSLSLTSNVFVFKRNKSASEVVFVVV